MGEVAALRAELDQVRSMANPPMIPSSLIIRPAKSQIGSYWRMND